MKFHRIYAVILRHMYLFRRSYDKMVDTFYWITLDLLLWGITSVYFSSITPNAQQIIFMFISGVILWNITYKSQIEINMGILEELWNKNLINLFVSPLTFREWLTALISLSVIKSIISFLFGAIIGFILYKIQIFDYSIHILSFIMLLMMSGWWLGFFVSGLVLRFGTRVQTLAWTLVWIMSPLSAIYYPLEILPNFVQIIAKCLPTSYVFEQGRNFLATGQVDYSQLAISFVLNIIYIILGAIFLRNSFTKVLQKGLVKVY